MIAGKTMLQHVFEQAGRARYITELLVATDDQRIFDEARRIGAPVRMTRADHPSGTDRAAEVASAVSADIVVNIQGDEPLIDPDSIDAAILGLKDDRDIPMGTLKKRIEDPREVTDPNVVKVVTDRSQNALYFSRSPIPYVREGEKKGTDQSVHALQRQAVQENRAGTDLSVPFFSHYKHIGLYVYRREFLLRYPGLPIGPLEQAERLEQLRALENGHLIRVVETGYESLGVDTPEDLARVSKLFEVCLGRSRQE
jgi:3-deoxy-manno-octulosonate cytidylyltransferase (CMP-KDO synthetase)